MEYIIYQVDTFTKEVFGGNPAAVLPNATGLTEDMMQKIATEMNLSETAFVFPLDPKNNLYEIRFFTPKQEVDLCGHATIGAFHVLVERGYIKKQKNRIKAKQKTKSGILDVYINLNLEKYPQIMMEQTKPQLVDKKVNQEELCYIMGITPDEFGIKNHKLEPQIISTGLKDIIFPVKSLKILENINVDMEKLKSFSEKLGVVGVHVFTLETVNPKATANCRNFAPYVGINEESATGTSNGALGVYLVENKIVSLKKKVNFLFEQGYFMNRPSEIFCTIQKDTQSYKVMVGGQGVICLEGVLKF